MLQRFQELVLGAVEALGPHARIADVRMHVEDRLDRGLAFGAVFTTLDRLEAKGLVSWRLGDPSPARGGRAPRLYSITADGVSALAEARALGEAIAGR